MGRKKSKNPKCELFAFRCTKSEANKIILLAKVYAGGDKTLWLKHAAVNGERKFLKK